jgi:hypothetical protein
MDQPTNPPPTKKKKPRPGPKKNFSPDMQKFNTVQKCQKALRDLVKKGYITDPEAALRYEQGWDPAVEMAVMSVEPDTPKPLKGYLLGKLNDSLHISATDRARLEAGDLGGATIHISIAGYAAGPERIAIEPPTPQRVGIPALDLIKADPEVARHRGTPITPEPTGPRYAEYRVENGVAVAEEVVVVTATPDETIETFGATVRIKGVSNG